MPSSVRLPFHLQRTPRTITETEAGGLRGGLLPPPDRFAETGEHKLRRGIAAIGLVLIEELLDDNCLGLIDDHTTSGVTISLERGEKLDLPGQRPR